MSGFVARCRLLLASMLVAALPTVAQADILLIISEDIPPGGGNPLDVITMLENNGLAGETFDIINPNLGDALPTPAGLQAYDVVLVYSNLPFPDALTLGNRLAEYVDAGGDVVLAAFAFDSQTTGAEGFAPLGRFESDDYNPLTLSAFNQIPSASLGIIQNPNSPIVSGVNTLTCPVPYPQANVNTGSVPVAFFDNGDILVAERQGLNGRIVAVNFYPIWFASGSPPIGTGEGGRLLANAVVYAGNLTGLPTPTPTPTTPGSASPTTPTGGTPVPTDPNAPTPTIDPSVPTPTGGAGATATPDDGGNGGGGGAGGCAGCGSGAMVLILPLAGLLLARRRR